MKPPSPWTDSHAEPDSALPDALSERDARRAAGHALSAWLRAVRQLARMADCGVRSVVSWPDEEPVPLVPPER